MKVRFICKFKIKQSATFVTKCLEKSMHLLYWQQIQVSIFGNLWKLQLFSLLFSPRGAALQWKFICIKLYIYSYHTNCFVLHMCHSFMAQSPNKLKKNKYLIVSFLILKMAFWRPLYVIAGIVYYSLSRRPLVYIVSLLCCRTRICALKYYQQMIKKKKVASISSPLPRILC